LSAAERAYWEEVQKSKKGRYLIAAVLVIVRATEDLAGIEFGLAPLT